MAKKLEEVVDEYVQASLSAYRPNTAKKRKIIKDPIWNMIQLSPLESAVLDLPLLQRLRRIHQTALAFFTFPAAVHTRFEHTLGVVAAATRVAERLSFSEKLHGMAIEELDLQEVRLAALLHDIGHCALSHLSEPHLATHHLFAQYEEQFRKQTGLKVKAHELMGRCIVLAPSFVSIFQELVSQTHGTHRIEDSVKSLNRVADMIVGRAPEGKREQLYLSNIINGAFDADKIDYIARDSYFTGIALGAEIEMLMHKLLVHPISILDALSNKDVMANAIIVDYGGGVAYEQIALSKKSLSVNVYNHQKVMAAHELARDLIHLIIRHSMDINGKKYNDPALFLSITDWDMLAGSTRHKAGRSLQRKIAGRILPRRALRIAKHTLQAEKVQNLTRFYEKIRNDQRHGTEDFRRAVADVAGVDPSNIFVGVPEIPSTRELLEGKCRFSGGDIEDIAGHFAGGVDTYGIRREMSYVYALGCPVTVIADAAKQVLESETYGPLKFQNSATASLDA